MPVLFAFPRSTRSNRGRTVPLHSAMRKSGGGTKSIRRRIKTVHFASTKTLLSAPRPPPSLPLIPYDSNTNINTNTSAYDPRSTSYSNTTQSASSRNMPGSSTPSSLAQAQILSPDLIAYYQPSKPPAQVVQAETVPLDVEWDWEPEPEPGRRRSGRTKTPREKLPKTPHPRKAIDLPAASPSIREKMVFGAGGGGGAGDSYFPSVVGYTPSQTQSHSGHDAGHDERGRRRRDSSVSVSGVFDRLRGRSRSHSQSQSRHPAIAPSAAPAPPPQGYAHAQNGGAYLQVPGRQRHGSFSSSASASGSGSGSAFSSGSGSGAVPIPMQTPMSSSAPSISHLHAQMNARNRRPSTSTGVHGVGYGYGYANGSNGSLQPQQHQHQQPFYPPTSSPSAAGHTPSHSGGTRSRTSSFNIYPSSHSHSHSHSHQHPHPHAHTVTQPHAPHHHHHQQQSRHHHSASATTYPNPPPTVRRRSYSNPPETRRHVPTHAQTQAQGVYTPQQPLQSLAPPPPLPPHVSHSHSASSASPYLNLPPRDSRDGSASGYTRRRAGSFSYGAPIQTQRDRDREREGLYPSPQSHLHIPARERRHGGGVSADNSPNAAPGPAAQVYSQQTQPQPQMLRRRTYSNPHLPSSTVGARYHSTLQQQQQPVYSSRAHPRPLSSTVVPHRYLAVLPPSSSSHTHSHSHSQKVQISWDMRFPPSTATRSRLSRGATKTKVHYLSPQALAEPATSPACGFMRVSCTRLFVHDGGGKLTGGGAREGWPWPIAIYPPTVGGVGGVGGGVITLHDVLQQIYASLRTRASEKEYERLLPDRADKRAVSAAYEARWREETRVGDTRDARDAAGERNAGLRRVDFLRGRTRLVGLEPVGGVEGEWCLVVS